MRTGYWSVDPLEMKSVLIGVRASELVQGLLLSCDDPIGSIQSDESKESLEFGETINRKGAIKNRGLKSSRFGLEESSLPGIT